MEWVSPLPNCADGSVSTRRTEYTNQSNPVWSEWRKTRMHNEQHTHPTATSRSLGVPFSMLCPTLDPKIAAGRAISTTPRRLTTALVQFVKYRRSGSLTSCKDLPIRELLSKEYRPGYRSAHGSEESEDSGVRQRQVLKRIIDAE
jgi:hypothetical protein